MGKENGVVTLENNLIIPQNLETWSNSTSEYTTKKNENIYSQKNVNIYSSIVYNSQKVEIT